MTHTSGKRHTKILSELEGRSTETTQSEKGEKMEKQTLRTCGTISKG